MYKIVTLVLVIISLNVNAQSVSGTVEDASTNSPLSNATIKLSGTDSTATPLLTVSDAKGNFTFKNVASGSYTLSVTSVGYSNISKKLAVIGQDVNVGNVNMAKSAETLATVVIKDNSAVKVINDTVQFAASQYKVNPDATAEDLIKKMPGITVDKGGTVTAQGETVQKVTVDGRDFFGTDATATLRNLPSEVIDKIQVFDKLSDQAQLTGFDDGNTTKAINIVTKKDMRSGQFGRIYGGYGTDNRYSAGGNVSFFNNARRISLVGLFNNVNQQNFSSQDLLGVTSAGNRGGAGRRGGGGGGGNNFTVGQQSGIAKTDALGINYSDAWGKKIDVTASYFFNNSNTSNNQTLKQQNILKKDSSSYYDENTLSDAHNNNNRANFRLNYKIDSANTLLITSNLNFQTNNSVNYVNGINYVDEERQDTSSKTANDLTSNNHGYSISNEVLYRHAFPKRGRSISLGINTNFNNKNGQNFLNAVNDYYKSLTVDTTKQVSNQKSNVNQYSFNLVYTEPLGQKTQLQANYNPAFQTSEADQRTYHFDNASSKYSLMDTSLSNVFNNTYNTQNAGITFRNGDRNNMLSAGVSYQYSELKSDQLFPETGHIDNTYSNFLANAFARFKFSSKSNLRVIYRGSVSPPSVNQLQNVINNSNPFFLSTGNPDLQQQYSNRLILRYNYTDAPKSKTFFANIFLQSTNDYVANATYTASKDSVLSNTITLYKGSQISKPVNLNGYISARSFFTFGMPLTFIKSNLNWNGGISYSKLPGLLNNVKNVSNNFNYNVGAVLSSNISEYVDFTLSYSANINTVKNTIQPSLNNNYFTSSAGVTFNLLTKKGLFLNNDLSNETYKGLSAGLNQNFWLWNIAVGQKFLKNQNGELKLSVFDLLKQNKSITRNVTDSYIQDVQNQVLQQYFMLTFTYKLRNFGKGKPETNEGGQRNFGRFGGPGGPPFGGNRGPGGPSL
jgi:outer membrane beta-barrel protein/carboxypeptidase-like protein